MCKITYRSCMYVRTCACIRNSFVFIIILVYCYNVALCNDIDSRQLLFILTEFRSARI